MRRRTHEEALHELSEKFDIPVWVVRSKGRFFGKDGRCTFCNGTRTTFTCRGFDRRLRLVQDKIINDYAIMCCPECENEIDGFETALVFDSELSEPPDFDFEEEYQVRVKPCGCIIEEEKYIPDIDREAAKRDARE